MRWASHLNNWAMHSVHASTSCTASNDQPSFSGSAGDTLLTSVLGPDFQTTNRQGQKAKCHSKRNTQRKRSCNTATLHHCNRFAMCERAAGSWFKLRQLLHKTVGLSHIRTGTFLLSVLQAVVKVPTTGQHTLRRLKITGHLTSKIGFGVYGSYRYVAVSPFPIDS